MYLKLLFSMLLVSCSTVFSMQNPKKIYERRNVKKFILRVPPSEYHVGPLIKAINNLRFGDVCKEVQKLEQHNFYIDVMSGEMNLLACLLDVLITRYDFASKKINEFKKICNFLVKKKVSLDTFDYRGGCYWNVMAVLESLINDMDRMGQQGLYEMLCDIKERHFVLRNIKAVKKSDGSKVVNYRKEDIYRSVRGYCRLFNRWHSHGEGYDVLVGRERPERDSIQ